MLYYVDDIFYLAWLQLTLRVYQSHRLDISHPASSCSRHVETPWNQISRGLRVSFCPYFMRLTLCWFARLDVSYLSVFSQFRALELLHWTWRTGAAFCPHRTQFWSSVIDIFGRDHSWSAAHLPFIPIYPHLPHSLASLRRLRYALSGSPIQSCILTPYQ